MFAEVTVFTPFRVFLDDRFLMHVLIDERHISNECAEWAATCKAVIDITHRTIDLAT